MNGSSKDRRPVVVGVDHSDSAREAAEWAADISSIWGAPLHLVNVVPGASDEAPLTPIPSWLSELRVATRRAGADPDLPEVVPGSTVELLSQRARGARLLVLGSYGDGAWSGMLAGSVALALVGRATCPVAVVRGTAPQLAPPRNGPVVVGVDGSPSGRAALALAADLASSLGAGLVAVHTWSDVVAGPDGAARRCVADAPALAAAASATLIAELAPVLAAHPDLPVERHVVGDTPLRALLTAARRARMIVVGQRGHRPPAGMLLGSTSQALVEFAPCPIVVTRADPESLVVVSGADVAGATS
ncbi:universal stress protein [Pseudonocardia sp. GCM10023141]|uniref:universal stress protein n=1 Tax=Pseudonocardia sp. GCM10023141 TaxID=3252653 RepID=UPI00361C0EBB